jgi:tRNA A-37 threonylcarbamoyl transferase component Bud32
VTSAPAIFEVVFDRPSCESGNPGNRFLLEFIPAKAGAGMTKVSDMAASPFRKISKGEIKGWLREDLAGLLPPTFFKDPVSSLQGMKGQVIKESRLRWAAIFSLSGERMVFFKRDRTKGWAERLKFLLLPSKARKEWSIACQLQKKNLDIPKPLGWIEKGHWGSVRESYYISEAIGSGTSLIDLLDSEKEVPIEPLAKKVRTFHDAGLFHKDLHGGNFLWDGESLFLTDLHRAEIVRSLSLDQRLWNLSQLFHSLRSRWGREDFLRFLGSYFEAEALDAEKREDYFRKILASMEHLRKRWWRSRTKRCLKESTEFSLEREGGTTVYHRKDFSLDQVNEAIRRHRAIQKEDPASLLKQAPESIVSAVGVGKAKICVKQFRYPHLIDQFKDNFRNSKGLKAWIAGNGLRIRDIPSLTVMAYVERREGLGIKESFLVMEASEKGQEMDRYLYKGFRGLQGKALFIKAFAQWLSGLHQKEIYHWDMKACNILVSEEGESWRFHLLDLEDVRLDQKVSEEEVFRNFLQLNTSIPPSMTHTDRLRFYQEYGRLHSLIRDKKGFLYHLIRESKERGVVYVTPRGVVEEKWS